MDGWFQVNSVVQDYCWKGDLVVIRYVAENDKEVVAECMGQDELGRMITRFLVVDTVAQKTVPMFGHFVMFGL